MKRVVLVTHDSVYGRYVAATLVATGQIDRLVIETNRAAPSFYWRKLRKVGLVDFGFQYWLSRWFEREGARHLPPATLPSHDRVTSVNTLALAPDELVLGFGTSYVTARTLASAPNGILNLHTGVLPQYRGVKSEFWAAHRRDVNGLGWTLHYMTPALDAGDVVLAGTVPWFGDSPAAARARILQDAVPAIGTWLATVRHDRERPTGIPQRVEEGAYYTTPGWSDWRAARRAWTATSHS